MDNAIYKPIACRGTKAWGTERVTDDDWFIKEVAAVSTSF